MGFFAALIARCAGIERSVVVIGVDFGTISKANIGIAIDLVNSCFLRVEGGVRNLV